MSIRRSTFAASLLVFGLALIVPATSSASVEIQAHRGGPNIDGEAAFPENSLPGFKHSLKEGYTIEFDVQSTSDGFGVIMHDESLDRTTTCTGEVEDHTLAELASCRLDVVGSEDVAIDLPPSEAVDRIPRMTQMISLLEKTGGKASIEVKNLQGTFPGFPPEVYGQLEASDIPSKRVTVQNFKTVDLSPATGLYPGVTTSFLSLAFLNPSAVRATVDNGFTQVSPEWPIPAEFVADAHAADLTVAPFTIDDAAGMKTANALGVDAVITNDPTLADRLVGPRPALSLKFQWSRSKTRARPGHKLRLTARVSNTGKGQSDPGRFGLRFNRSALKPVAPASRRVPVIKAPGARIVTLRVKIRRGTKRFGRIPVRLRLTGNGKLIKKVIRVRVLRPRK